MMMMTMMVKVLTRVNLPKSYVLQLRQISQKTRILSRSAKRLSAVLPLTTLHQRSGTRQKKKIEAPLKPMKTAMTLTQMIWRLGKKGPFATTVTEMSALLSSEIRAGLTS